MAGQKRAVLVMGFVLSLVLLAACGELPGGVGEAPPSDAEAATPVPDEAAVGPPTLPPSWTPSYTPTTLPTVTPPATPTASATPLPLGTVLSPPTSAPPAEETIVVVGAQASPMENGWTLYTLPSEGFALGLPPGWVQIDLGEDLIETSIALAAEENPEYAVFLEGQLASLIASSVKFFGFDVSQIGFGSEYATNASVIKQFVGAGITVDFLADQTKAQLEALLGPDASVTTDNVTLPAGEAARVDIQRSLTLPDGNDVALAQVQYILVEEGELYVLTLTTLEELYATTGPIFEEMAESFRFTN